MRTGIWAALAAAILLGFSGAAAAQQPSQAQINAIKQSCRSDYQRVCSGVPTGGSAALQCLQQNANSVSAPCQQALAAMSGGGGGAVAAAPPTAAPSAAPIMPAPPPMPMSPRQQLAMMRVDCGPDFRRFCSGVPLGGGRAIGCLQAHGPQLSRQCRGALMAAQQSR